MIVPLLVAIAIGYWESASQKTFRSISRVAMLPVQLNNGAPDELARELTDAVHEYDGKENLRIESTADTNSADAVIEATITRDAGIVSLELRLLEGARRRVLWRKVYQSSAAQSPQLMQNAARALFQSLRG
jgi:TolB-like protein